METKKLLDEIILRNRSGTTSMKAMALDIASIAEILKSIQEHIETLENEQ